MTLDDLKKHFKHSYAFELEIGMAHGNWVYWEKIGYIPIMSQLKIQRLTDGALQANVEHIPADNLIGKGKK